MKLLRLQSKWRHSMGRTQLVYIVWMMLMLCPLVSQAALRQQMAMQQRQEAMRLLSTLTPEQREQLGRLPSIQQVC